ncbi:hypothetical protein NB717_000063 [Xanthomonas sacchari]|uniref:Uncharacterized protein n=1 Tax=Xanthomonas sontii TaxID=2650745 RepID=A0A6N7Q322_9XANT|nr:MULTISPECIES: hypothetical protein [Xanthomonas]MCW0458995.1 hypothetical protein [Xanthomonas sacchari]MRG98842.1 hypothetical protein [Xanthomonas sontii]MRH73367.1 hypothetical protein [Xanthomonas sontii]
MFKSLIKATRRLLALAGGGPSPEEFERFKQACVAAWRLGDNPNDLPVPKNLSSKQIDEIRAAIESVPVVRTRVFTTPVALSQEQIDQIREAFARGVHAWRPPSPPFKREGAE